MGIDSCHEGARSSEELEHPDKRRTEKSQKHHQGGERTSRYAGQSENIKVVQAPTTRPISGQSLSVYLPNDKGTLVKFG